MKMHNPAHPGRILAASFDENFTVEQAAQKINVPVQELTDIMEGKAPITTEIAILLSVIFPDDSPSTWIEMQTNYNIWQIEHNQELRRQILAKHGICSDQA